MADFYGINFLTDYSLFGDEFEDIPAVYVIYTETKCLEIDETDKLRTTIETHPNTLDWVKEAGEEAVYIAFNPDPDPLSRIDKKHHLIKKMKPILQAPLSS